jgi:RimJ/RimL family protein N-acetyltransferase
VAGEVLLLPEGGLSDGVVCVRPYRREDAVELREGARDEAVARFAFVRWADDTLEQLAERISVSWREAAKEGRALNCSIRDAASDRLLGHLVLYGVDWEAGRCEVGFWLMRQARGRGASARAVDLLCRWAFDRGLARVQATTDVANVAAQRTLESAGFSREGILRSYYPGGSRDRVDHAIFSRLAND